MEDPALSSREGSTATFMDASCQRSVYSVRFVSLMVALALTNSIMHCAGEVAMIYIDFSLASFLELL